MVPSLIARHASAVLLSCIVLALASLASLPLKAPEAFGSLTVSVRVEGESSTLRPLRSVTPEAPEPVSGCPVNSATTAINLAVEGTWDHGGAKGSKGDFTETILGETHNFTHESDTWAVWIDDKWAGGICEDLLAAGDEVLLVADHEPPPAYAPTVLPLVLAGVPASVEAGTPFTVQTKLVHTRAGNFPEIGEGTATPQGGVIVSGGGASAMSDEIGSATLCVSRPGSYSLIARRPGDAPSAPVSLSVRGAAESVCGAQPPWSPTSAGEPASAQGHPPYVGPFALVPHLQAPLEGHVYAHGHAPRLIVGSVSAHSAVSSVSVKLRRRYRGRCYAFNGTTATFRPATCGRAPAFKVSSNAVFSYFLPFALPPGRYVLDIEATDVTGNHTSLARGTSRIVFYVR
jgi:hypothetical protein